MSRQEVRKGEYICYPADILFLLKSPGQVRVRTFFADYIYWPVVVKSEMVEYFQNLHAERPNLPIKVYVDDDGAKWIGGD